MVLRDTTLRQGTEGQPERRLTVLVGSVNLTASVVRNRVWRVEVDSPRFRTRDSLGVGSTVAQLRAPGATLALGEGAFVLRRDHCGLSFKLGAPVGSVGQRLDQVPDSVRVERVLVIGCGSARPASFDNREPPASFRAMLVARVRHSHLHHHGHPGPGEARAHA